MVTTIKVCQGHACRGNMSKYTFDRLVTDLEVSDEKTGLSKDGKFKLETCPCQGKCVQGPNVVVEDGVSVQIFSKMTPVEMGQKLKFLKGGTRSKRRR